VFATADANGWHYLELTIRGQNGKNGTNACAKRIETT